MQATGGSPETIITEGMLRTANHLPSPTQLRELASLYQKALAGYRAEAEEAHAATAQAAAWQLVAEVLLNTDEMLTR
jgi:hypothetical protein